MDRVGGVRTQAGLPVPCGVVTIVKNVLRGGFQDGLDPLDLSWWELGPGQLPRVCRGSHRVASGHDGIEVLAEVVNTHGYLRRPSDFSRVGGTPLFQLSVGAGRWIACELMLLDAAPFDPIARRLLSNVLANLSGRHSSGSRSRRIGPPSHRAVQTDKKEESANSKMNDDAGNA